MPQNRIDQSLEEFRVALSLDPLSPIVNMNYGLTLAVGATLSRGNRSNQQNHRARSHFHAGTLLFGADLRNDRKVCERR